MADVLVVAVHPDDETLGCGGTLLRHKSKGDTIHWLIVTAMYFSPDDGRLCAIGSDGNEYELPDSFCHSNLNNCYSKQSVQQRAEEIREVKKSYGFATLSELMIPTTTVSDQSENVLIQGISSVIAKIKPSVLYIPFANDTHGDHRAIFPILNSCVKTFRYPYIEKVLIMETISETEYAAPICSNSFTPNYFVCIDSFIHSKISIMSMFKSEYQKSPFPRSEESILAQCLLRGTMAHCKYAESFMLLREIVR